MKQLITSLLLIGSFLPFMAQAQDPVAPASVEKYQAGKHYQVIPVPVHTANPDKIEVNEVFWYGCGHCYALDPALENWKTQKPAYIDFVRIPVIWGQAHRQHAKLYYTLQALHRPDLHSQVFDAIHLHGIPLGARDDLEARAQQLAFLESKGVTEKEFNAAYDSMTVAANMQRAEQLTKNYAIANVPTLIVNGKYSTGVGEAGGTEQLLSLINDLAASEKNR